MSKIPATTHSIKWLLKFGLVAIAGLVGQSAFAMCPVANEAGFNVEALNIGVSGDKTIFFCKQDFTAAQLNYVPTETELLTGGSRAISKGNTVQAFPMGASVNLSGFSVTGLPLNTLTRKFPNTGGRYNKQSLFNFYTRISNDTNCPAEYMRMKNYLRSNPNRFTFAGPTQLPTFTQGVDLSIGTFNDVKLAPIVGTGQLTASVELYHTNPGNGQFFRIGGGSETYCWLGVGARLNINPNAVGLTNSGSYGLQIGVATQ